MTHSSFDRSSQDVGNIIGLEHVNITVPNQDLAALFYITGLGLTRDPYVDFGLRNMWINAGSQQFHLPTAKAQNFRGRIGLVIPDINALKQRLSRLEKYYAKQLQSTQFSWRESEQGELILSCPWGNHLTVTAPSEQNKMELGIPWVELNVAPETSEAIARFYSDIIEAPTSNIDGLTTVKIGRHQQLRFRETTDTLPEYDGHHIAIYLANFSRPYTRLRDKNLITIESNEHEYRFQNIVDPKSGEVLATIEHEVRSMFHPMFARELANRNAQQSFSHYKAAADVHRALNHGGIG